MDGKFFVMIDIIISYSATELKNFACTYCMLCIERQSFYSAMLKKCKNEKLCATELRLRLNDLRLRRGLIPEPLDQ